MRTSEIASSVARLPQSSSRSGWTRLRRAATVVGSARHTASLRAILLLSGGTATGGAVAFISMPLIARLYSPAEYSLLGLYTSFLAVCSVSAMLRYEFALPIGDTEECAGNTLGLCLVVAVASSCAVGVAVYTAGPLAARALRIEPLIPYLWLLPVGVLLTSTYQALSLWATRHHDFSALAKTKLSQSLAMTVTQVGSGVLHVGPAGLLLGHVVGQSGGIGTLGRRVLGRDRALLHEISFRAMFTMAVRYRRFPCFSALASLLDSAVGNIPLIVLAGRYGSDVGGFYTLVQRGFAVPMSILSCSIGQVTLAELADARRRGPDALRVLFRTRVKQLAVAALVLVLVTNICATLFVPFLFGDRWTAATTCLRALSPMLLLGFVASPLGFVLEVTERQDLHLYRELFRLAVMGTALSIIAFGQLRWEQAVLIVSAAASVNSLGYLYASHRALGRSWLNRLATHYQHTQ